MLRGYFTKTEKGLWLCSVLLITVPFLLLDRESYLSFVTSLIGVTAVIFLAKGNPIGQAMTVVFSCLYGIISYTFSYYGEMITYLGMTMPMAVLALVSWLKNPYQGNRAEVAVSRVPKKEWGWIALMTALVTAFFCWILKLLGTANLFPSTLSVTTSFMAVYLTFRRSPWYAVWYAANDLVLIVLWTLAAMEDMHYLSVVLCFTAFFANDLYGFINWRRMAKRQNT